MSGPLFEIDYFSINKITTSLRLLGDYCDQGVNSVTRGVELEPSNVNPNLLLIRFSRFCVAISNEWKSNATWITLIFLIWYQRALSIMNHPPLGIYIHNLSPEWITHPNRRTYKSPAFSPHIPSPLSILFNHHLHKYIYQPPSPLQQQTFPIKVSTTNKPTIYQPTQTSPNNAARPQQPQNPQPRPPSTPSINILPSKLAPTLGRRGGQALRLHPWDPRGFRCFTHLLGCTWGKCVDCYCG